ncbi:DUF2498 family protein [Photorhabdus viridis]
MLVDDVAQKGDVLVFRGESFLDEKKRIGRYIKTL